jgi:hypothetical protein
MNRHVSHAPEYFIREIVDHEDPRLTNGSSVRVVGTFVDSFSTNQPFPGVPGTSKF